jgi:hypothetical protein
MEPLSMFLVIFRCITTGKTAVSDGRFIQNDNTNLISNSSFFFRNSYFSKYYENVVHDDMLAVA